MTHCACCECTRTTPDPLNGSSLAAALLIPAVRGNPIHLIDVWDPGTILRQMAAEGLMSGAGATFFLTSLLDHPDFDLDVHLPLMGHVGLGGATVPEAIADRTDAMGISRPRVLGLWASG